MTVPQLSRAEAKTIVGKLEPERAGRLRARPALIRLVADERQGDPKNSVASRKHSHLGAVARFQRH